MATELPAQESLEESYDSVPYPSYPFRQTHPDQLYAVATLFGLTPALPSNCRVLELGCAAGGNLIPMADQLPSSEFVGIDVSNVQVQQGQLVIEGTGLSNIQLKHMSIDAIPEEVGTFDYIICHGVYSWVPSEIQSAIFDASNRFLNPNGIAYISYNTYPGWRIRGMIRDMMKYHTHAMTNPKTQIEQSRALLKFLADSIPSESSYYGSMLNAELEILQKQSDSYLFHEHLESFNEPIYFHQLVERATEKGLAYLGDSDIATMWIGNFPNEIAETLNRIAPNIVQREQYSDFVRNRTFRQSLFCKQSEKIDRNLDRSRLENAYLYGHFKLKDGQSNVNLNDDGQIDFISSSNSRSIGTSDRLNKAAFVHLTQAWPASIAYKELAQKCRDSLAELKTLDGTIGTAAEESLAKALFQLIVSGVIKVHFSEPRFTKTVSATPTCSKLARYQSQNGKLIVNQKHELVNVTDLEGHIIGLLDGTRNKQQLEDALIQLIQEGKLIASANSEIEINEEVTRNALKKAIDQAVAKLALSAMLLIDGDS